MSEIIIIYVDMSLRTLLKSVETLSDNKKWFIVDIN